MICIIANSLGRGGAERSALLLFAELVRREIPVQFVSLYTSAAEYPVDAALEPHMARLAAHSFIGGVGGLFRLFLRQRPRTVFSLMPQANLTAMIVCRALGLRVYSSERTTPIQSYRPRAKLMLALLPHVLSARAIFISHFALEHGLPNNALGRAVRRNASVLHNPVPSPVPLSIASERRNGRAARLRAWCEHSAADDRPTVSLLFASRLMPGKGILEVLTANRDWLRSGQVRVTIVGAGPMQDQLRHFIDTEKLHGYVELRGFVDDIWGAYEAADVVILSSRHEGFGRVGFEAYQSGCLLLGTWQNSFAAELVADAPGWLVMENLESIRTGLRELARRNIPADGADINVMAKELGVEVHADRFLDLISAKSGHG